MSEFSSLKISQTYHRKPLYVLCGLLGASFAWANYPFFQGQSFQPHSAHLPEWASVNSYELLMNGIGIVWVIALLLTRKTRDDLTFVLYAVLGYALTFVLQYFLR